MFAPGLYNIGTRGAGGSNIPGTPEGTPGRAASGMTASFYSAFLVVIASLPYPRWADGGGLMVVVVVVVAAGGGRRKR